MFIFGILLYTGHGPLPQLTGNVSEVLVSSLLQSCYLSSQTLPRVYQHYGPSPIQPLSTEMQILLTVYYLVQLGQCKNFAPESLLHRCTFHHTNCIVFPKALTRCL